MPTDSAPQGTERERIVQEGIAREVERVMGVPYHPTQFAGAAKNLLALLAAAPSGELRPICAHCDKPSTHLDPAQSFYPACDEHGAGAAPAEHGERAVVEEAYSRGWEDYRDWMPYRPTKACADLLAATPAGRSWPERVDDAFRVIANAPVESESVEDVIAGLRERIDALQSLVPVERAGLRDLLEYIAREYGRFMSDRDRQKVGAALAAAPAGREEPFNPLVASPEEYAVGRIIRAGVDYDVENGRFYLMCSVGELAQRICREARALAAAPREQEPDRRPVFNGGKCPKCGSVDTRAALKYGRWYSRCEDCKNRWSWTEADVAEPPAPGETQRWAVCSDCGRPYGENHGFPDLILPDEVWETINPTSDKGAGLLCPCCIVIRCVSAGLSDVPAEWGGGPLVAPGAAPTGEAARQARQAHLEGSAGSLEGSGEAARLAEWLERRAEREHYEVDATPLFAAASLLRTRPDALEDAASYVEGMTRYQPDEHTRDLGREMAAHIRALRTLERPQTESEGS